jgi:hypothetical protein
MADDSEETTPVTKPTGSAYLFSADAQAVLEASPNLDAGLELLAQAYDSRAWDDSGKAKETASKYATLLRNRFEDDPLYHPDDAVARAPIDVSKFTGEGETEGERFTSRVTQWEKANTDYLDSLAPNDTGYIIDKDKLKRSIANSASTYRRLAEGGDDSWVQDKFYRAVYGMSGGILKGLKADQSVKYLQEHTNPLTDKDISSNVAQGAGFLTGIVTSDVIPAVGPTAYLWGNAAGETRQTYRDTLENTGDPSLAKKAAALEFGSQATMNFLGQALVGGTMTRIGRKVFGDVAEAAIPTASQQLKTVASKTAEAGAIGLGAGALSGESKQFQSYKPETTVWEDAKASAISNAIFGAGLGSLSEVHGNVARSNLLYSGPSVFTGDNSDLVDFDGLSAPPVHAMEAPVNKEATQSNQNNIETEPPGGASNGGEPPPDAPAPTHDFETEDGTKYTYRNDGATAAPVAPDGTEKHALDRTFYVDQKTYLNLKRLQNIPNPDGSQPEFKLGNKDNFYVSNTGDHPLSQKGIITPMGKKGEYRPEFSTKPAEGLYPVSVNGARTANGVAPEYRAELGGKITSVVEHAPEDAPPSPVESEKAAQAIQAQSSAEGQSVGAAFAGQLKTTKTRERILESPDVTDSVKQDIVDNGIQYFRKNLGAIANEGDAFIAKNGIQVATDFVMNRGENEVSNLHQHVAYKLAKEYNLAAKEAERAGDFDSAYKLASKSHDMFQHLEAMHNTFGLVGRYAQELYQDPEMRLMAVRSKVRANAESEVASEEGITPKELAQKPQELAQIQEQKKAIEAQAKELKKQADEENAARPESKRVAEKAPEEHLPEEQKQRLKDLNQKERATKRIVDKTTERTSRKVKEAEPHIGQLGEVERDLANAKTHQLGKHYRGKLSS